MTKQDEKQRIRRRLQEYALELAAQSRWQEAVEMNRQILTLEEDAMTYNCLGKAYMEQGFYQESHDAYQQALRINPTNVIARKNISRLESLMSRGVRHPRDLQDGYQKVDPRLFITEAGRTAITTLCDVPRSSAVETLSSGDRVELIREDRHIVVVNADNAVIGKIEPRLGQRLNELIAGGNRYIAAVAQCDPRHVRLLIREVYQHPSQQKRVSFPLKLSELALYGFIPELRFDYEVEELMEDEDIREDESEVEEELPPPEEEEEIGLDDIEKDLPTDDEEAEE
ncbi:MAG: tetratricopeptide repeat protein [Chloroflexaceae bacterium]|nr:tetratricopeptide repeat protein [Chloroflexaceae bacterium]